MPRTSRPITVTLGELQASVDKRVKSGAYSSTSEVLRDAVRALDREDAVMTEYMKREIMKAINDPHPGIPAEEVYEEMQRRFEGRRTREREGI